MNSSIVSEKEPVKRCNKPSLYWIISHGIISLRDYLHLEGETPSPGIGPRKKHPALQGDLCPWKVRVIPKLLNVSWRCRIRPTESRSRDGLPLGEKKTPTVRKHKWWGLILQGRTAQSRSANEKPNELWKPYHHGRRDFLSEEICHKSPNIQLCTAIWENVHHIPLVSAPVHGYL